MTEPATRLHSSDDFKVADLDLAAFGRREISIAETEMPALMSLRNKYLQQQPLKGARIAGSLHMTIQTAVLIETLVALGAEVRWASCNIFSTQDHAAAAMAAAGVAVYAWKGQTEEEAQWCIEQTLLKDGQPWNANLLLDDGGDLTAMVYEQYPQMLGQLHGVSEETTTGVKRLQLLHEQGLLRTPAINVNDSVTKSKNDNRYGCRHSLNDAIKRATDHLLAGKRALVIGYGDVGKGSAQSLRQEGALVQIVEIDPICAMQACMDGFEVVSAWRDGNPTGQPEDLNRALLERIDLVVTATGNANVCDRHMLAAIRRGAVVCNIGHFDHEIDTRFMREHYRWEEIKPQVHRIFRDCPPQGAGGEDFILLLSEGRLVNLGNATGHPSRVMDGSFANQVLAQIELFRCGFADQPETRRRQMIGIEVLPTRLDEEVAAAMVAGFGGVITRLTEEQASYINIPINGPFKSPDYRY